MITSRAVAHAGKCSLLSAFGEYTMLGYPSKAACPNVERPAQAKND